MNTTNIRKPTLKKTFYLVIILLLIFFIVNIFITFANKPRSAYDSLTTKNENSQTMLQDTRVHNWSEIEKRDQNPETKD